MGLVPGKPLSGTTTSLLQTDNTSSRNDFEYFRRGPERYRQCRSLLPDRFVTDNGVYVTSGGNPAGEMTGKVYLVGGAVRDELMGYPAKERDWVVVGGTPEEMLAMNFRQVGASFPVFLHPDTGEEYALARTERKQGHGYHGFNVDFHPVVTLEEDLARRDLTINAIARDDTGVLIDPFGGQKDLEQKILRHVSPAFSEDPLRVLRVARFAARFSGLGFRVHESTMELMQEITQSGELNTWPQSVSGVRLSWP